MRGRERERGGEGGTGTSGARYRKSRSSSLDTRHRNVDLVNHAGSFFPQGKGKNRRRRSGGISGRSGKVSAAARHDRMRRRCDARNSRSPFFKIDVPRFALSRKHRSGIVSVALWMHLVSRGRRRKRKRKRERGGVARGSEKE